MEKNLQEPFGISLDFIEAYDRAKKAKVINEPVRDEGQDYWDFMNEPLPEGEGIFTPEIVETLKVGAF